MSQGPGLPKKLAAEFVGTLAFILMSVVLGTAVDPRSPYIGGFGIGVAVLCDELLDEALTGAAMNPARAVGPMIARGFLPPHRYIYWIEPVAEAVLASLACRCPLQGWRLATEINTAHRRAGRP